MLLAESQLPVTAIEIGVWIGCASFVLGIVRHVIGIKADSARIKQGTAETPLHLAHPLVMSESKDPAIKSEVEDELERLLEKIDEVKAALSKAVKDITASGQARADAITQKIDSEVRAIRADVESRMALVHEKVNGVIVTAAVCESDIEHLKARDYQHDQSLATLQQRTHSPRKAG